MAVVLVPVALLPQLPHLVCCQLSSTSSSMSNSTSNAPTRLSLVAPFGSSPAASPGSLVLQGGRCMQSAFGSVTVQERALMWAHDVQESIAAAPTATEQQRTRRCVCLSLCPPPSPDRQRNYVFIVTLLVLPDHCCSSCYLAVLCMLEVVGNALKRQPGTGLRGVRALYQRCLTAEDQGRASEIGGGSQNAGRLMHCLMDGECAAEAPSNRMVTAE